MLSLHRNLCILSLCFTMGFNGLQGDKYSRIALIFTTLKYVWWLAGRHVTPLQCVVVTFLVHGQLMTWSCVRAVLSFILVLSFVRHNLPYPKWSLNLSSLLWPQSSLQHKYQILDSQKWNCNTLFTIVKFITSAFHNFTRWCNYLRQISGTKGGINNNNNNFSTIH